MNRLSPLLELRGEWRQAAAVTIPAAAAELAAVLDRSLDLLDLHGQLDEQGLTMAIDVVCRAVKGRPDEIELFRHRLRRAARDYTVATAANEMEDRGPSEAFASEAALADALFNMGAAGPVEAEEAPAAPAPAERRLDERALGRSLSDKGRKRRRALMQAVPLVLVLLAIAGAVVYFLAHPPTVVVTSGPQASATAAAPGGALSGTLAGTQATCPSGAAQRSACTFTATMSGVNHFRLSWIPPESTMTLQILDASGKEATAPVSGSGGALRLTTPTLANGTYTLRVSSDGSAGPIQFQLSTT